MCIGRWALTGISVLYILFVIINCAAINDAVNCVKLASEVLFNNSALIFQPIVNIFIKLIFFLIFGVVIAQALSTAGFSGSDLTLTVPDPQNAGST